MTIELRNGVKIDRVVVVTCAQSFLLICFVWIESRILRDLFNTCRRVNLRLHCIVNCSTRTFVHSYKLTVCITYVWIFHNKISAILFPSSFFRFIKFFICVSMCVCVCVFVVLFSLFIRNKLCYIYELITKRLCAHLTIVHWMIELYFLALNARLQWMTEELRRKVSVEFRCIASGAFSFKHPWNCYVKQVDDGNHTDQTAEGRWLCVCKRIDPIQLNFTEYVFLSFSCFSCFFFLSFFSSFHDFCSLVDCYFCSLASFSMRVFLHRIFPFAVHLCHFVCHLKYVCDVCVHFTSINNTQHISNVVEQISTKEKKHTSQQIHTRLFFSVIVIFVCCFHLCVYM